MVGTGLGMASSKPIRRKNFVEVVHAIHGRLFEGIIFFHQLQKQKNPH